MLPPPRYRPRANHPGRLEYRGKGGRHTPKQKYANRDAQAGPPIEHVKQIVTHGALPVYRSFKRVLINLDLNNRDALINTVPYLPVAIIIPAPACRHGVAS